MTARGAEPCGDARTGGIADASADKGANRAANDSPGAGAENTVGHTLISERWKRKKSKSGGNAAKHQNLSHVAPAGLMSLFLAIANGVRHKYRAFH